MRTLLVSVDQSADDISATGGRQRFVHLRVCCSLPTLMDQGIFIVRKSPKFVNTRFVSLS
jgi:hypothetical protein